MTAEPYRGHGVALAMIEYALQLARRKGCYKVMLLSGQQRTGAHQLYLKAGFDGDRERDLSSGGPRADSGLLQRAGRRAGHSVAFFAVLASFWRR